MTAERDLDAARAGAEKAARAGAEVVRHYAAARQRLRIHDKGTNELVTEADVETQRAIVEALAGVVPGAHFMGEEEALGQRAQRGDELCWIIDPIDGTTNFMHGVPPYAVSIGLVQGTSSLAGVVYDVAHDELFSAARGRGLTLNGAPAGVSATEHLSGSLVATGFPYRHFEGVEAYLETLREFFAATRGVRRHGAASVDLAWVACGRFDAFFETGLSAWDVAGGVVLVEEGGGCCTAFAGTEEAIFSGQMIASNGLLHPAMQRATRRLRGVHT